MRSGVQPTQTTYRPLAKWPDAVAYREAIQTPAATLTDPEFRNAQIVLDRRGFPVAYSGRFAIVFRLRTATGDWAVRCFTQSADMRDHRLRYAAVARRLQRMGDCFVPFRYMERGIRIGAEWYPVIAMRWASGETLGKFVDRCHDDPVALGTLQRSLTDLLEKLESAGIAHGDWQHDNILVSDGGRRLTLVDYDGMFVPEMTGAPALETGHANYQHPGRTPLHFGLGLDRFAHTALTTALLALMRDSSLWQRFNDGESVLFRAADYKEPNQSPVFAALREMASRDTAIAAALQELERSLREPFRVWNPPADMIVETPVVEEIEAEEVGEKWWMDPEVAQYRYQPTAVAAESIGTYLSRLKSPESEREERENIWTVRTAVLARAGIFGVLWMMTGRNELLWLWAGVSVGLIGLSYLAWPRRAVGDEVQGAIEAAQERIAQIEEELRQKLAALGDIDKLLFTTDRQAFVDSELQQTDIGRVYYDTFLPTTVIDQLRGAGITRAVDLGGKKTLPGVSAEHAAVLKEWFEERRRAAEKYFDQLSSERQRIQSQISALESERLPRRQELDSLQHESRQLPDASLATYLQRLGQQS